MCSLLSRSVLHTAGRFLQKSSATCTCKVSKLPRWYSKNPNLSEFNEKSENQVKNADHNLGPAAQAEYDLFRDEDAETIFDVDEEMKKIDLEALNTLQPTQDPYAGLKMQHGVDGVFDIQDLVDLLNKENAQNIFVVKVPKELGYVDYIVIVNGKTFRHMTALATYVRKAFKLMKHPHDILPKIEGKNSKDWMALDLGNIALHIFSNEAREEYDLETLWSLGSKYDKLASQQTMEHNYEDRYNAFMAGLQPADAVESQSKPV